MHVQLDKHKLTSLADPRPRRGWSMPRIGENSDTFISYCMRKYIYNQKMVNTCLRVCLRQYR
jgi:hypothetical protein